MTLNGKMNMLSLDPKKKTQAKTRAPRNVNEFSYEQLRR